MHAAAASWERRRVSCGLAWGLKAAAVSASPPLRCRSAGLGRGHRNHPHLCGEMTLGSRERLLVRPAAAQACTRRPPEACCAAPVAAPLCRPSRYTPRASWQMSTSSTAGACPHTWVSRAARSAAASQRPWRCLRRRCGRVARRARRPPTLPSPARSCPCRCGAHVDGPPPRHHHRMGPGGRDRRVWGCRWRAPACCGPLPTLPDAAPASSMPPPPPSSLLVPLCSTATCS